MANDPLFAEIDDDLRREQMRNLWRALGSYIITVTGLILVGTIAIVGWQTYNNNRSQALTAQLLDARHMAENGRQGEAIELLDKVTAAKHSTLSPLAALWAAELSKKDAPEAARAYLQPLLEKKSAQDPYHHFAALLMQDTSDAGDAKSDGPFAMTQKEIQAFSLLAAGKKSEAASMYRIIAQAAGTPDTLRQRAQLILATELADELAPEPADALESAPASSAEPAP
ncbi:MAG: hypothetical protein K2Q12_09250 [Rickettsiales bacterium]|nr:hypothetical protein [Rickettsiales bacterium]